MTASAVWLALAIAASADAANVPARPPALRLEQLSKPVQEAEALVRDSEWHKALGVLDAALAAGLPDPRAYELRAEVLVRLGRYGQAVADAQRAAELLPGKEAWNARRLKSIAENGVNEYLTMLKEADAALRRNPADAKAFYRKAWALAGVGDKPAARENLRLAAGADSSFEGSYFEACALPEEADLVKVFQGGGPAARSVPPPPIREAAVPSAASRAIPRRLYPSLALAAGAAGLGLCLLFGRRECGPRR